MCEKPEENHAEIQILLAVILALVVELVIIYNILSERSLHNFIL